MAIVGRGGEAMHDLALPLPSGGRSRPRLLVERGADDLVYLAEDPGRRLFAVSSSGEVTPGFELVGPPDLPLTALRFSQDRVAAFYGGPDRERAGAMIRWAVVHDMATGRHVATYGPLPHMVVCYVASGVVDQFTMLRFSDRQWQLLEATAQ